MPNDDILMLLSAPLERQVRLIEEPRYAEALRAYLGAAAFDDYAALAQQLRGQLDQLHLGPDSPKNLLFVPGVMGSMLQSHGLGGLWWIDIARGWDKLNKLGLQPDGAADIDRSYDIRPSEIDIIYAPFRMAALQREDFGYDVLAYDWRKPLSLSTARMRDKIVELHASNGEQPVHLVAHSMGGLLTRATLAQYGDELWPRIGRIVFIGTPHYGAALAACRVKFHLWDNDLQSVALALLIKPETFRSMWGPLGLIPAPRGIYPGTRDHDEQPYRADAAETYPHPCVNFDPYDARAWDLGLSDEATDRLQRILDHSVAFYQQLREAHLKLDQSYRDRMAVIAGVGTPTAFRLTQGTGFLGRAQRDSRRVAGDPHRESDGTVPLASAQLEYVGTTRYIKGIHATLPTMPAVYSDVFRWLRGERMQLDDTPEGALSQHLAAADAEEFPNMVAPAQARALAQRPELDTPEPDPALVEQVRGQIEAGQLPPEYNLARLF